MALRQRSDCAQANLAKYLASEAFECADRAMQTHGGFGYAKEYTSSETRESRLMKIAPKPRNGAEPCLEQSSWLAPLIRFRESSRRSTRGRNRIAIRDPKHKLLADLHGEPLVTHAARSMTQSNMDGYAVVTGEGVE